MKKSLFAILVFSLISMFTLPVRPAPQELAGTVTLSGAWALYPMAVKWSEEFSKLHPKVRVDVQAGGAGKGIADALAGVVDLGMVSREIQPVETEKGAFAIAVVKDGVIPTICAKNPLLGKILASGLKKEAFTAVWITETAKTWGDALGTADKTGLHVYTRSDACGAAETWAAFLEKRQEDLKGIGVYGDPGLAEAVRRDPLGIGFNNINYAYDAKTLKPLQGIAILPIDLDGSGKIEPAESFYQDRDAITAAIAKGAYPSPPARDLYLVSKGRPQNPLLVEFLRWVLNEGQKFVAETGYIGLSPEKLADGWNKIQGR
ncbi:MAG: phosphate ABC transporter substrate-binding protein [Candidatus Aminicenantes bacterium RBG_13_62_12]|nr:MAG: phosphate ABC transporter substrate-binding protein [Candidatus Aminicenantes bacterium RBG_13_62_12]